MMVAWTIVLTTIGFDNQLRRDTSEIDDIGRNRVLTPETPTELFSAQTTPKQPFGIGRCLA